MSSVQAMVYKIAPAVAWVRAREQGFYTGSADDLRDGFIHLSSAAQLAGTLARHFAGQSDLLLIAFATADLGNDLKWETSRGGDLFPHCYGNLVPAKALWTQALTLGADGIPYAGTTAPVC